MTVSRRHLLAACTALPALKLAFAAEVPAYHKNPPTAELPPTKDPDVYIDRPLVQRVYQLAGKIRPVLYQMPCYCRCDKFGGHTSLLDCFVDAHGEECGVCQREAVYSYVQTKAGKSPKEIRDGIMAGEWKTIDMSMPTLLKL